MARQLCQYIKSIFKLSWWQSVYTLLSSQFVWNMWTQNVSTITSTFVNLHEHVLVVMYGFEYSMCCYSCVYVFLLRVGYIKLTYVAVLMIFDGALFSVSVGPQFCLDFIVCLHHSRVVRTWVLGIHILNLYCQYIKIILIFVRFLLYEWIL